MFACPSIARMHVLLLASAACLSPILCQTALAQDTPPREPIIVTGRGLDETPATPAYGTIELNREQITSSASGRIEDVLSSVAGFQQFRRSDSRSSNPSAQGVTLRALGGNATSRALVLLDGVPMADPFFGYMPLSAIAPERLESVRVTRGGGSGAFGAGAVAGTIELTSADADTIGLVNASALVDDRAETELSGTIAPELGQGFVIASARWDRGKGFWTTPVDQRVPASARARFDSWSTSLRGVAPLNDTVEVQLAGLAFEDHRTLRFKGANSSSRGFDTSLRFVGRGDWQFDVLGYLQTRNFSNIVISSTRFVKVLDQRDTPSTGLGGKIELRPPVGDNHVLRFGSDLRISDGKLLEEAFSAFTGSSTALRQAGGRNSDLGFFVEDDWTLGRLVLTAGARVDRWTVRQGYFREFDGARTLVTDNSYPNRSGWDPSFRGGAVWNVGKTVALRASAYSGLRLPTLNELYRGFVVFPVTTLPNASLKNEELVGYEAGIDYAPSNNVSVSVTAFDNRLKNAIANVTLDGATCVSLTGRPECRQRRNVNAIHAQGLEFGANLRFGAISFIGSLALTDAKVKNRAAASPGVPSLDGMRPAQTPKIAASGTLAWEPHEGWRLAATLRHVGKQFEDDLETDVLPAATTLGAYVEVPVSPVFSLVLRGENLTNERIVTRNQGGSIDLGVPRTVWAGIKVRTGR